MHRWSSKSGCGPQNNIRTCENLLPSARLRDSRVLWLLLATRKCWEFITFRLNLLHISSTTCFRAHSRFVAAGQTGLIQSSHTTSTVLLLLIPYPITKLPVVLQRRSGFTTRGQLCASDSETCPAAIEPSIHSSPDRATC
jgi:hypothetical protein